MTNLWVRADMHTDNPDTRALIAPELREEYTDVMLGIGTTAVALSEAYTAYLTAQERVTTAIQRRAEFFSRVMGAAGSGEIQDTAIASVAEVPTSVQA